MYSIYTFVTSCITYWCSAHLRQRWKSIKVMHQRKCYNIVNTGINEKARASNIHKYNKLLASIELLNKDNWKGKEQDEFYGESDIQLLCDRMDITARNCILGFRDFRNSISQSKPMSTVPHTLQQLFNAVDKYVISTAECERSFSVMNDILTPTRNSLKIDNL